MADPHVYHWLAPGDPWLTPVSAMFHRCYYTAAIINRHSEGVEIKVGFSYLITTVASNDVRTPGHTNEMKPVLMSTVY